MKFAELNLLNRRMGKKRRRRIKKHWTPASCVLGHVNLILSLFFPHFHWVSSILTKLLRSIAFSLLSVVTLTKDTSIGVLDVHFILQEQIHTQTNTFTLLELIFHQLNHFSWLGTSRSTLGLLPLHLQLTISAYFNWINLTHQMHDLSLSIFIFIFFSSFN